MIFIMAEFEQDKASLMEFNRFRVGCDKTLRISSTASRLSGSSGLIGVVMLIEISSCSETLSAEDGNILDPGLSERLDLITRWMAFRSVLTSSDRRREYVISMAKSR